jgi:hypothetical protein
MRPAKIFSWRMVGDLFDRAVNLVASNLFKAVTVGDGTVGIYAGYRSGDFVEVNGFGY